MGSAVPDAVSVGDDRAAVGLPEDVGQLARGMPGVSRRSLSTLPAPILGNWRGSPTNRRCAPEEMRRGELVGEVQVQHRRLIDHDQVSVARVVLVEQGAVVGGILAVG